MREHDRDGAGRDGDLSEGRVARLPCRRLRAARAGHGDGDDTSRQPSLLRGSGRAGGDPRGVRLQPVVDRDRLGEHAGARRLERDGRGEGERVRTSRQGHEHARAGHERAERGPDRAAHLGDGGVERGTEGHGSTLSARSRSPAGAAVSAS